MSVQASPAIGQNATVRGFITAASDREPLQGVNVVLDDAGDELHGAVSNSDGFFLVPQVPPGRYQLRASFIGFETYVDTVDLATDERLLLNIALRSNAVEMNEIAVEAERESGAARVTAGQQTIRAEEIELIPAPDVSGDLVSYLSTMPGVVLMGDRGGQVFIRGGEPTHNLTIIDGMEVYQPFHILGFYSAFPAEIINRADVYAGGFGAEYNGRISSVIDVQTRNGNKRAYSASASMSPFTSAGRLEGPIIKDHVSFLGTARFSMLDQLATEYVEAPMPYMFNDIFAKLHVAVGGHQASVSVLSTYDRGTLTSEDDLFQLNDEIRWWNTAYGARYLVAPQAIPMLGEVVLSFSRLITELGPSDAPTRSSRNQIANLTANFTNFARYGEVNWGFYFRPATLESQLDGLFQNFTAGIYRAGHAGAYVEPDINLGRGLHVRPGLSLQVYGDEGGFFDPRLRVRWDRGIHHWSAAAGLYRQEITGISDRRDATNIFTAWVGSPTGEAARALHTLLGYRITPTPWLEVSLEGFYKNLDHLSINEWTAFPSFTTRLQEAQGWATGFDLRLEVRGRRFYGLVNYGLSSTRYELVPNPDNPVRMDLGPFRPPHDRRHQINLLANARLYGFDLSVKWQYGSGLPYTQIKGFDGFILMNGAIDVENVRGFPRVIYDEIPYQAVLPDYHRLDVSLKRTFTIQRLVDVTMQVGVMNLYDRANLFTLDLFTAQRSDQLPLVPLAGLQVEL